ncbi:DNA helicase UvrD [Candidatus Poribacteria bacterium]|nr:DNA helicase UvrD [Candidatus Poribacteria bacterium]
MKSYTADFHVHSYFSRATSKDCKLEHYDKWAQLKGVQIVGTGDFTHPGWSAEIEGKLLPSDDGLFILNPAIRAEIDKSIPVLCKNEVKFILTSEVSCIYKKNDKVRKIHVVIFAPDFATIKKINSVLDKIGNIKSDGRPILGLDVYKLLEIVLESHPLSFLVPAHIWTPHFSLFGACSGFDKIEDCFEDLTPNIFALETGLSSDPQMNWRLSALDRFSLISNSDAHSPQKLAREANVFSCERNFSAIRDALKTGKNFDGTIEFFPEEGKYHYDGHRSCKVNLAPWETISRQGMCPVCGKNVTVGVMHRVELLSDRKIGEKSQNAKPFKRLVPLTEIICEAEKVGTASKKVDAIYFKLLNTMGNELYILQEAPIEQIKKAGFPLIAHGIKQMRAGKVKVQVGYDGEYGKIKVLTYEPDKNLGETQLTLL